jgi:hypothetical protein
MRTMFGYLWRVSDEVCLNEYGWRGRGEKCLAEIKAVLSHFVGSVFSRLGDLGLHELIHNLEQFYLVNAI